MAGSRSRYQDGGGLRERLSQVIGELAQHRNQADKAKQQLADMQKQLTQPKSEAATKTGSELGARLSQVEGELAQRSNEADKAKHHLAELQEQLAQSISEAKAAIELRHRLATTESALVQRRQEVEETAAELAGIQDKLRREVLARQQIETLAASYKEHVDLLLAEVEKWYALYIDQDACNRANESELKEAIVKVTHERDRIQMDLQTLKANLNGKLEEQTRMVNSLKEELKAAREIKDKTALEKAAEINRLKADISTLTQASKTERERLESQIGERFAEIATLTQHRFLQELAGARRDTFDWFRQMMEIWLAAGELPRILILSETSFWQRLILRRKIRLLQRSGVFDPQWYLIKYEDIAKANVDPAEHYIKHGLAEGRSPNSAFDK